MWQGLERKSRSMSRIGECLWRDMWLRFCFVILLMSGRLICMPRKERRACSSVSICSFCPGLGMSRPKKSSREFRQHLLDDWRRIARCKCHISCWQSSLFFLKPQELNLWRPLFGSLTSSCTLRNFWEQACCDSNPFAAF
jgi:hypothetical protein